jgi:hypothetical protein
MAEAEEMALYLFQLNRTSIHTAGIGLLLNISVVNVLMLKK